MGAETRRVIAGRFALDQVIGRGGMGAVWRASDLTTGQSVAVKLLQADGLPGSKAEGPQDSKERFLREMKRTASVKHPNVVHTIDYGEDPEAGLYLVLELLEGLTFKQLLRRERHLGIARAVKLISEICEGLQAAHDLGLVHRDVKPGNLICLGSGDAETAKLIDFGIARGIAEETQLTGTGLLVGTVAYCAPEQVRGERVDAAADVYAIGAVFYELVTGEEAFPGPGMAAVIHQHLHHPPPRLKGKIADADYSPVLDAVLSRCLAKSPADRFGRIEEVASSLRRAASGGRRAEPLVVVEPAPPSPQRRLLRSRGRDLAAVRARSLVSLFGSLAKLAPYHQDCDEMLLRPLGALSRLLQDILTLEGKLELSVAPPMLHLNGKRIEVAPESVESVRWLAELLASKGVQALTAVQPPGTTELSQLLFGLAGDDSSPVAGSAFRVTLGAAQVKPGTKKSRPQRSRSPVIAWSRARAAAAQHEAALKANGTPVTVEALPLADELAAMVLGPRPIFLGVLAETPADAPGSAAANVALLAAAICAEAGLAPDAVREVAYLGLFAGAGLPSVDPLAQLWSSLAEEDSSPVVLRRLMGEHEVATELSRFARRAPMVEKPGVRSRAVLTALMFWRLRIGASSAPLDAAAALAVMQTQLADAFDPALLASLARLIGGETMRPLREAERQGASLPKGFSTAWLSMPKGLTDGGRLSAELVENDGPTFWVRLAKVLRRLAEARSDSLERLFAHLLRVLEALLLQEEFGAVADVLAQLSSGGKDPKVEKVSFLLASRLSDEDHLLAIGQAIAHTAPRAPRDLTRMLGQLDTLAVPSLLQLLDVIEQPESRTAVLDALVHHARRQPQRFFDQLSAAKDEQAADLILILHKAGQRLPSSALSEAFKAASSIPAKEWLLDVASQLRTGEGRSLVLAALDDSNAPVRSRAVTLAAEAGPEALAGLLAKAKDPRFGSRAVAERESFYAALAAGGSAEANGFLSEALRAKGSLLSRSKVNQEKLVVVAALKRAATIGAARLLQEAVKENPKTDAGKAAEAALEEVRRTLGISG